VYTGKINEKSIKDFVSQRCGYVCDLKNETILIWTEAKAEPVYDDPHIPLLETDNGKPTISVSDPDPDGSGFY
jgi:hypothetical protein